MKRLILLSVVMCLIIAPSAVALGSVQATFLNQDPDPVEPGEYVELRWRVENVGSFDIDKLKLEMKPKFPFAFDTEADRVQVVPTLSLDLEGDKSYVAKFRTRVNDNAITGDEEIELKIRFKDGSEKLEKHFISIQSRDLLLAIKNVRLIPERPRPGEMASALITVENLEDAAAEDVQIKLDLRDMPIAALQGTNEQFLRRLGSRETHTFNFTVAVAADAESTLYQVPVLIKYSDKFGGNNNYSSSFGCSVEAPPEYIVNIRSSDIVTPKTAGQVVVSMSNIGASDINYVSMAVEGSEKVRVLSNDVVYMGNLESDDYETAEFDLYVNDFSGDIPLNVLLNFKDSYNRNVEENIQLKLKVYSQADAMKYGLVARGSYIGWIVLVIIIAGAAYWQYRRRK
ncbi:MAG: COG1361 S-layer family protein [Candidatus Nanoarchaeia archaeon]